MESNYDAHRCDGTPGQCDGTVGLPANFVPTPLYWEAWSITSGKPSPAYAEGHDKWFRSFEPASCGTWSIKGTLFVTETIPLVACGVRIANFTTQTTACANLYLISTSVEYSPFGTGYVKLLVPQSEKSGHYATPLSDGTSACSIVPGATPSFAQPVSNFQYPVGA